MNRCNVKDCGRSAEKAGLCGMHYRRKQRHGDPQKVLQHKGGTLSERFARKVVKTPSGCWEWSGKIGPSGYAAVFYEGRWWVGSRASWEIHCGPIPEGMCVLHTCDNRVCTNPDHLFLGSNLDNIADKVSKGRQRWANFGQPCSVEGCNEQSRSRGMCRKHYNAQYHAARAKR